MEDGGGTLPVPVEPGHPAPSERRRAVLVRAEESAREYQTAFRCVQDEPAALVGEFPLVEDQVQHIWTLDADCPMRRARRPPPWARSDRQVRSIEVEWRAVAAIVFVA